MTNKKKVKQIRIFKNKNKGKSEDDIIKQLKESYDEIDCEKIKQFQDFPLSEKTIRGLKKNRYFDPTEIQLNSIGFSLCGEDILGAAKTGSGKTLAFLIPLLETLYCKKWTCYDGVGGLVITPTRELAYQIFETLKKVGEFHDFSAGLIIGGKDLKFESKRMDQCNIIICTPGRLLQHMDENALFDASTLQILVLDEADRCLDMGFEKAMNSIIENLPAERQTLLFSATQTKSVKDLARLSLRNPRYISVHEDAKYSTPTGLVQSYILCELADKMNFLWSFIKNHRAQKILIFMSSCKQVKYTYEALCRLRPGVSLLALYGSLHQSKRMAVYDSFCQKQHAVLFATDIAARGLDFPAINWVVQLDCPESANEYIHRAGRTARYQRTGECLLVLLPSEMKMLQHLEQKKIPIQEIQMNMVKLQNIQRSLETLLARDTNLKASAQRSFVAYVKSVFLMKDKEVFDVISLDTDAYARSLGLALPPRIRFLQKRLQKIQSEMESDAKMTYSDEKLKKILLDENNTAASVEIQENSWTESHKKEKLNYWKTSLNFYDDNEEDDDDFLYLKRKSHELDVENKDEQITVNISKKTKKPTTRVAIAKKMLKKNILPNKKIAFDDEGEIIINKGKEYVSEVAREYAKANKSGIDIPTAQLVLKEEDKYDKEMFRQKVKRKHKEQKNKLKQDKNMNGTKFELDGSGDEFDGSGDESDVRGDESDLSSLPDEKLNSDEDFKINTQFVDHNLRKRKPTFDTVTRKAKNKKILCVEDESEDDLQTLARDEEIAMQILNMKS